MRKKLIAEIFDAMYTIKRRMLSEGRGSVDKYSLPHSQWMVLLTVEQRGKIQVKEVAKALGITSSAATQLIDHLVEKGFLKRKDSQTDRRTKTIELSEKSCRHIKKMKLDALKKMEDLLSVLTAEELKIYARINQKIILQ